MIKVFRVIPSSYGDANRIDEDEFEKETEHFYFDKKGNRHSKAGNSYKQLFESKEKAIEFIKQEHERRIAEAEYAIKKAKANLELTIVSRDKFLASLK